MNDARDLSWAPDVGVGIALLALVAVSLGLAYVPMGWGNLVAALAIAVVQAGLVGAVFMELRKPKALMRMCAASAVIFIGVLFTLAFADYFSRPLQMEGAGQPVKIEGSEPGYGN